MAHDGGAFEQVRAARPAGPRRPDGLGPRVVAVDHPRRRGAARSCTSSTSPSSSGRSTSPRPGPRGSGRSRSAIGSALSRPAFVPAPHFALRAVIGEFADYVIASQRVEPAALLASGFTFEHPDLDGRRQVAGAALIALIRQPCGSAHEAEVELTPDIGGACRRGRPRRDDDVCRPVDPGAHHRLRR